MLRITITSNALPKFVEANNLSTLLTKLTTPLLCLTLVVLVRSKIFKSKPSRKVFLLDFACYKPPAKQMWSKQLVVERTRQYFKFSEETLMFMEKLLEKSGLGPSTYLPEAFRRDPPCVSLEEARKESEMVIFGAVDELLGKTGVKGEDIGILIVNCCVFNAVPSLSSMIVNRYKLRDNTASYNLSGMGCSAGLAAISLAKQLLQVHSNSYALVVSTENITGNHYDGEDRSMIIINCLFRLGGAAILLSNKPSDCSTAKYQIIHSVLSNTAAFDQSYNCISLAEDSQGCMGVTVSRDLLPVAFKAIKANLTTLGHLVLPLSEQILFILNYIVRHYFHGAKTKAYVPNFMKAFDHVITHVGGKPVLDEVETNLKLSEVDMEASRMTLYRFGNTSSSSIWYGLAYTEAKGRIKKGDCVCQIAFGSGFKCNSLIMKAIRRVDVEENNPWSDEIDGFPVDLRSTDGVFPYEFQPSKKI